MRMLALKSYEKTSGFSVLNTDELYYVNGGSGSISVGVVGPCGWGGVISITWGK